MPRSFRLALGAAAFMLLAPHALQADDDLLGTWRMTNMLYEGQAVEAQIGQRFEVTENEFRPLDYREFACTYEASTETDPHTMDLTFTLFEDLVYTGIYKIEGDTLTMCFAVPVTEYPDGFEGGVVPAVDLSSTSTTPDQAAQVSHQLQDGEEETLERPTEFSSTAENGYVLQVLTRIDMMEE